MRTERDSERMHGNLTTARQHAAELAAELQCEQVIWERRGIFHIASLGEQPPSDDCARVAEIGY